MEKKRIEILESLGFTKNDDGNWFEYTSQITLNNENIMSISDEEFNEEIGLIEYLLSK